MIRAGELRSRITIQTAGEITLSGNQVMRDWDNPTVVAKVWAKVVSLTGTQLTVARQIYPEIRHEVTIRYRSDVTTLHRLLYRGRQLRILGPPVEDEKQTEMTFMCSEEV